MAKAIQREVIDELRLTEQEFDWEDDSASSLPDRVNKAIANASIKTQMAVGASNYASVSSTILAALKYAEHQLTCANMLRQRLIILSSRPEEAPPPDYIDLNALQEEIDRYERDWKEITAVYKMEDFDAAGSGWAFSGAGIDETYNDDYDATDFDELS